MSEQAAALERAPGSTWWRTAPERAGADPRPRPRARAAAAARPGVRGLHRLRRPRQLRHEHLRRRQVRLHAAVGDRRREPDGDADPEPHGQGRHRHGHATWPSCAASTSRGRSAPGLWVQAELIAMATDLAEFIGAAIALNLLFGVPLFASGLITAVVAFGDPRRCSATGTGASRRRSSASWRSSCWASSTTRCGSASTPGPPPGASCPASPGPTACCWPPASSARRSCPT